jgi:hypothetical protein
MALFFSSSLAMDKFVISRVVIVIDYPSIAVFDQARCRQPH